MKLKRTKTFCPGKLYVKILFCMACLTLTGPVVFAQKKFTISGIIRDAATGETMIGATIRVKELAQNGTSSNNYGFYSLSVPDGDYTLLVNYVGYTTASQPVTVHKNIKLNIALNSSTLLQEVVINSKAPNNDQVISPQMGVEKLEMSQINSVPVLLGERDILKTISLLPGVKSASEGNTGFYVRGGASDQNLILLDEAIVYNASHLFGFFSTFNSDAVKDVSLYKGGMPAQFGGRLSSVVDIKMDEGNNKDYRVQGGLGLISSRLKVEGPLIKDRGSFMVSARRTYIDFFLKASSDTTLRGSSIYFYDLNAKVNYHLNDKNTLYLSGYFGKDVLTLKNTFGTDWGNATGTLRWNHLFNSKLFSNTSLIYSNYNYDIQSFLTDNNFKAVSKINDLNLKEDLQYFINSRHLVKFGMDAVYHSLAPGTITSTGNSSFANKTIERRYGVESALYISDQWHISDKFNLLYGLRFSGMFVFGPGTFFTYNATGDKTSSKTYGPADLVRSFLNVEPRISASYSLNDQTSVKASYNRNTQNVHIITNATSSTPTDLYVMNSNNIRPEIADQLSTGYFKNFAENTFEFSAEVYYKWLKNQIDYKNGAQLILNQDVESQLIFGKGRAYGIELFLKKHYGRFNGWIGYTLSRTERLFDGVNNNHYYPAKQDRTHDLAVVGIYKWNKRWSFSGTFVYSTGNAVTYPGGKYLIGGLTTYYYTERNGYREPATNRLDLGATLEGKEHKKYHSSFTFGIYNIYNHRNPYTITFRDKKDDPTRSEAVQTSLFGRIPSITWNFKF